MIDADGRGDTARREQRRPAGRLCSARPGLARATCDKSSLTDLDQAIDYAVKHGAAVRLADDYRKGAEAFPSRAAADPLLASLVDAFAAYAILYGICGPRWNCGTI